MKKKTLSGSLIFALLLFFLSGVNTVWGQTSPLSIDGGSPIRVSAWSDGYIQVYRYDSSSSAWEKQIYGTGSAASKLFLNGTTQADAYETGYLTSRGSGNQFTYNSHSKPDNWTIVSTWTAGSTGVTVTQTVTYVNGDNKIRLVWQISNGGETTYNDVRFTHVQDTYLDNQDSGFGHWNGSQGMVYISNPNPAIAGIMGMYGGSGSAASRYDSISYSETELSADGGQLSNTVIDGYSHDAAYALQWNRSSLAPGQTWTVTMYEKFTEPGSVLVTAPSASSGLAGTTVNLGFTVENLQASADTFDLEVTAAPDGWSVSIADGYVLSLDPNQSQIVDVEVVIPAGATIGDVENVTLTAVSQTDTDVTNTDTTSVTVADPGTTETLEIAVIGNGTTNPGPGSNTYATDSTIQVSAIPDSGSTFAGWTGDVPSGSENDNPVYILMDTDKSITATFIGTPTVSTAEVTNILSTSATGGGNVTADGGSSVTEKGVCWGTSLNPTIADSRTTDGAGTGSFTSSITGLSPGVTYHVRAYATNSAGTSYGNDRTFTTVTVTAPSVTTTAVSGVSSASADSGGNVTSDGGSVVTSRGVCWSTSTNPTTADSRTTDGNGTGSFTSSVTGLLPGTTYHVRAYAVNSVGTSYGSDLSFTTTAVAPSVTTTAVSGITTDSADSGGNVTSDGGSAVTSRGVCWSTAANPTTADNVTSNGTGTGAFSSSITGLVPGTTYHVRAYAVNSVGTSYGPDIPFTTDVAVPTVTTAAVSSVTSDSADSGGDVTADGGSSVTERGVCWGTTANPTTADSRTTDGSGTGSFTSSVTGLLPGTTYHVRAYAVNSAGTGYGSDVSFTTDPVAPSVSTADVSSVTSTSAESGGNVISDGGAAVTARGVCWSTLPLPSTADSITADGTGTGAFSSFMTGLVPGTTYYVRAYATNVVSTTYGNEVSFMADPVLPAVETRYAANITHNSAVSGGNVTYDGGAPVTERGVCWGTGIDPTILNDHRAEGSGTGAFTSFITGLSPENVYYIRAYATNAAGTAYGSAERITTLQVPEIFITEPLTGDSVEGEITVKAASMIDVFPVEFYIDGIFLGNGQLEAQSRATGSDKAWISLEFDASDAAALFVDHDNVLKKITRSGLVEKVLNRDMMVDAASVSDNGDTYIAFSGEILQRNGRSAKLFRLGRGERRFRGIDGDFGSVTGSSSDRIRFRFDNMNNAYYFVQMPDGTISFRKYSPGIGVTTLLKRNMRINRWDMDPEGNSLLDVSFEYSSEPEIVTVSGNGALGFADHEVGAAGGKEIHDFFLGHFYENVEVAAIDHKDSGKAFLLVYRPSIELYSAGILTGLNSVDEGFGMNFSEIVSFRDIPLSITGISGEYRAGRAFIEYFGETDPEETIGENENIYTVLWDTSGVRDGEHLVQVVGYDQYQRSFRDEVTVFVNNLKLYLSAQKKTDSAWIISSGYNEVKLTVDNPYNAEVEKFELFRKEHGGEYQLMKEFRVEDVQNGVYIYNDQNIRTGELYDYKVVAYDAEGQVISVSEEVTI